MLDNANLNELNELIEGLYKETCTEGELPQQSAQTLLSDAEPDHQSSLITRLRQVLDEMGAMLQAEDQPNMTETAPDQAACLRILNHWEQMMLSANGLRQHMQSLERDIEKMQPWGNFDVMKIEQLANAGCMVRFWQMPAHLVALRMAEGYWNSCELREIARDQETCYFVTVSTTDTVLNAPAEAHEVEICPCPISTLIMLQTRDKDSLKKLETLQGDYALCHYGEVYNALRQSLPEGTPIPNLHSNERPNLRQRLHALFSRSKV